MEILNYPFKIWIELPLFKMLKFDWHISLIQIGLVQIKWNWKYYSKIFPTIVKIHINHLE